MTEDGRRRRVVIMGAAGRDFHNFNVVYKDDPDTEVVAFTATQIPGIEGRTYPRSLAGPLYPKGVPILPEEELRDLVWAESIDEVVFAYSDVSHENVMHSGSIALAAGADFRLLGPGSTMLTSSKPVVAVCAVRTGAGKSQTTRRVTHVLREAGHHVVVVRHPMPYGNLEAQRVQRFASDEDLERHNATIEEREEFEPHLEAGTIVYCGIDYEEILAQAESESDVVVWDGGNNDLPFYRPEVHITVVDPLRAGHERRYHPGEANVRMAHVIVINKVDSATEEQLATTEASVRTLNDTATIVRARSPITTHGDVDLAGKRVLVVEDGPTLTHGEMTYGAGVVAARRAGAGEIVDPRPWATGSIADAFARYPGIGSVLPAMGYSGQQVLDLGVTINSADVDAVVIATPIDLRRLVPIDKPCVRVTYELEEIGEPTLADVLADVTS